MRKFETHSLGDVYETQFFTAFFGHRGADAKAVASSFPDYKLASLKQTHSNTVVEASAILASSETLEGDAIITSDKRVALCVRTADCVPVLIFDPDTGFVASIHAGWRGVANGAILKTAHALIAKGASLKSAQAFIGPHIGSHSFEVGDDVAEMLERTFDAVRGYSPESTAVVRVPGKEKKYIDLLRIVRAQLASIGIERPRVLEHIVDTVTSSRHESFRRDREGGGRQNSFIALK